jgi:3-hydroxyisobutyrate dehydrogenase
MKIGFIGLGMMGRGMAANLQKAGYALVVNDLTRQAASHHLANGATWAETPRAEGGEPYPHMRRWMREQAEPPA